MPRHLALVLFLIIMHASNAASFPTSGLVEPKIQEEEVIVTQDAQNNMLGVTYNVRTDDGTFTSTFNFHTDISNTPDGWYTLADGTGLYQGDIINITNLGESYTLDYSPYDHYLWANPISNSTALGAYAYFMEVPLGNGELILLGFCLAYILFIVVRMFLKKTNLNTLG